MLYLRGPLWLIVVAACHAAGTAPVAPQVSADAKPDPDPTLVALVAAADARLAADPGDGVALYQRASVMLVLHGAPGEALALLERLDATGWDIPLAAADFASLAGDPRYREVAARIAGRAPKIARSAVAFRVPGPDLIPEGIAVDPGSGTIYLSSLRRRTIVAIDPAGGSRRFIPERHGGVLGVTGMAVDPARAVLWAASHGSHSMAERDPGKPADGAIAFALADGSVRRRVAFGDGARHLANDLAIASDGTAYLTDSTTGAVFRIPADRDALEPVIPPGRLSYPNGIALAGDRTLYVADAFGIVRIALDTGAIAQVTAPRGVALGGIDGMVLDGDRIFAVQNAIGQPRIVAIAIDGDRATGLTVLENSPESLELPTTTCLWRGALYTIANSQIDAIGPDGVRPGRTLADPRILRTPL